VLSFLLLLNFLTLTRPVGGLRSNFLGSGIGCWAASRIHGRELPKISTYRPVLGIQGRRDPRRLPQ
jgi:hypothetical protein